MVEDEPGEIFPHAAGTKRFCLRSDGLFSPKLARWFPLNRVFSTSWILPRTTPALKLLASYAYRERKNADNRFKLGEGLVGQCALEKEKIVLTGVPRDYLAISSGLGEATPLNIIVLPVGIRRASQGGDGTGFLRQFSPAHQAFLDQLTEGIGIVLNTIEASMRRRTFSKQSQSLAKSSKANRRSCQQTNQQLAEKAQLLPNKMWKWSERTAKSSWPDKRWKKRRNSSP